MKEYDVNIRETMEMTVTVSAKSAEEAKDLAEQGWSNGEYVLTEENFVGADFSIEAEREITFEKTTAIMVEPQKAPVTVELEGVQNEINDLIGGEIDILRPFDDDVAILCSEGREKGMFPLNRALYDEDHKVSDIIRGTFLVVGMSDDSFVSLSPDQKDKFGKMFETPESFIRMGKNIMAIPLEDTKPKSKDVLEKPRVKSPEHNAHGASL